MAELNVPYYVQPNSDTCQSTCLKMMAEYVARRTARGDGNWQILSIKEALTSGQGRPNQTVYNHYDNYVWWLNGEFGGTPSFSWRWIASDGDAVRWLVQRIEAGYPVITSNRTTAAGHVILVIGFQVGLGDVWSGDAARATPLATRFLCHDPGGRYQRGTSWHQRRFDGASSLAGGGEDGPGKSVEYTIDQIRRGQGEWSVLSCQ